MTDNKETARGCAAVAGVVALTLAAAVLVGSMAGCAMGAVAWLVLTAAWRLAVAGDAHGRR